jgi:predicted DNA-binding antitoxin AbrB/MazE fold protein
MYAINAVYDGTEFRPKEPIPVNEEYEVVITFTLPLKNSKTPLRRFSKAEKDEITKSLFGVLPPDVNLDEARAERLR